MEVYFLLRNDTLLRLPPLKSDHREGENMSVWLKVASPAWERQAARITRGWLILEGRDQDSPFQGEFRDTVETHENVRKHCKDILSVYCGLE